MIRTRLPPGHRKYLEKLACRTTMVKDFNVNESLRDSHEQE
jgi:hypothetical protein